MPDHPEEHIGDRLRSVRKRRGLTQRELAAAAGLSVSLVRKLEQGELTDTRLETARRFAVALRVPTSSLIRSRTDEVADPPTFDRWASVRQALSSPPPDDITEPPTAGGVRSALEDMLRLRARHQFVEIADVLPRLLRDAEILAAHTREGRHLRFRVMLLTGWLLTQTRQFDAAEELMSRHLQDAGDHVQGIAMVNSLCWLLLRQGRLGEAHEYAVRWADDAEPARLSRATADELAAWGWMLLRVSNSSVRDARDGAAADALRMAQAAAVVIGHEQQSGADPIRMFGPTTVALKECENAMILDQPDHVLALAEPLAAGGMRTTLANWSRHRLDVANAQVRLRRYSDAMTTLRQVRAAAPQWLPHQRYARDIVGRVVERRRTLTPEMRELADTVRLPL
ncbi:DNA-binding protein [Streptomyces sp. CNQ-509]|uniref:helix-turn-helix domain-containing protein n=1 Tax=Streptomyces sp. CNQ-509 TaxID=444103 RepID=UPI00062DE6AE|nr:helix-turn-helix transcriptional regulator [Streptomyces sp. CNQ-509]AKH83152.1 DNA-binding protein [Streptomyces sp. CNQ-509]